MANGQSGNSVPTKPVAVLVVGSGGREHALCWKLAQSQLVSEVFCTPGNGGTAVEKKVSNVEIPVTDFAALTAFAKKKNVELVVVGPDGPLADGIVDSMELAGLRVFGPTKSAARLEWSKAHAKEVMSKIGIPTARFIVCHSESEARRALDANPWLKVVKVDGLARGKGAFVCDSDLECHGALEQIYVHKVFGQSSKTVVLEEKIIGEEVSLLYFCDGNKLVPMPACQDNKRRFDGDHGPNTGGMGACAPVLKFSKFDNEVQKQLVEPFEKALNDGTIKYKGILYAGLMFGSPANGDGVKRPFTLEFNARFGDPETQALLPLLDCDLLPILWSCTEGSLDASLVKWKKGASCCVVAAFENYPVSISKGDQINLEELPDYCHMFHAGTLYSDGKFTTDGGRIFAVTGVGDDMAQAVERAYSGIEEQSFKGMAYREDIGRRLLEECLPK